MHEGAKVLQSSVGDHGQRQVQLTELQQAAKTLQPSVGDRSLTQERDVDRGRLRRLFFAMGL